MAVVHQHVSPIAQLCWVWIGFAGQQGSRIAAGAVEPMGGLPGIQPENGGIGSIKGLIGQLANPPERLANRDALLDRHVGEQGVAVLLLASHPRMAN
jgi:hypothetical protein